MKGYKNDFEGDKWIRLSWKTEWLLACCDCGLVHDVERKLVRRGRGHELWIRMKRNEPETKALRRVRRARSV